MAEPCGITGTATIRAVYAEERDDAGGHIHQVPVEIVWDRADPEIHVAEELLKDGEARDRIEARYRVDEPCAYQPGVRHARLKDEKSPAASRCIQVVIHAYGLTDAAWDALFDRVAEAAHALDEEVTCSGQECAECEEA